MGHYSCHARLKQRIRNGELVAVREDREPFALRFFFSDGTSMPIRPYRVVEYLKLEQVRKLMPDNTIDKRVKLPFTLKYHGSSIEIYQSLVDNGSITV